MLIYQRPRKVAKSSAIKKDC